MKNKLQAEIERKRKLLETGPTDAQEAPSKIPRTEEPQAEKSPASLASPAIDDTQLSTASKQVVESVDNALEKERFNISNEEAVKRLRSKGQPVRLFAETDKERRLRLRALELIESRAKESAGQRNDFMKALEAMDQGQVLEELARRGKVDSDVVRRLKADAANEVVSSRDGSAEPSASENEDSAIKANGESADSLKDGETIVDLDLVKKNPHKLYPQIYFALKKILREWEQSMIDRPDHVKRSTQGKLAAATQKQSAEYLKPLFKSLRKRELEPDVLSALAQITYYTQMREYLKANDAYLRLSIGNAPWPIGVTMVGIHERSAREKINTNQTAHVLNDEVSRKYIQSLKRLMTFCQTIRPPADLSQLMG